MRLHVRQPAIVPPAPSLSSFLMPCPHACPRLLPSTCPRPSSAFGPLLPPSRSSPTQTTARFTCWSTMPASLAAAASRHHWRVGRRIAVEEGRPPPPPLTPTGICFPGAYDPHLLAVWPSAPSLPQAAQTSVHQPDGAHADDARPGAAHGGGGPGPAGQCVEPGGADRHGQRSRIWCQQVWPARLVQVLLRGKTGRGIAVFLRW